MTFGQAISLGFKGYVRMEGRSSRSEYWWWALFTGLCVTVPITLALIWYVVALVSGCTRNGQAISPCHVHAGGGLIGLTVIAIVVSLALWIPSLCLLVRRLHDTSRTGHYAWIFVGLPMLLGIVPFLGSIVALGIGVWEIVWTVQVGTPYENEYGVPPCEGRERVSLRAGRANSAGTTASHY